MNILLTTDSYKTSHHKMLPKGTTLMYGNFTPRSFKYAPKGTEHVISFGQQMVVRFIKDEFDKFFNNPNSVQELKKELSVHLGVDYDVTHFQKLHDLSYLPITFKALPEGTKVPIKVPVMTWYNTHPDFAWLPLYLETVISNMLWKPMTSATLSNLYRKNADKYILLTDKDSVKSDFMTHDFSSRGMSSIQSSMISGMGFLTSSLGTDNLPSIVGSRKYYDEKEGVAYSVMASEHSVSSSCIGIMGEKGMIEYYMKQYPTGILSIVSDTLDLTKVVRPDKEGYLYQLKNKIMNRDGSVVIRPDSAPTPLTPVDIVCGTDIYLTDRMKEANYPEFYKKGLIHCLWEIFGGTVNEQGYKVLDSHVGAIYGEAINLQNQVEIYEKLKNKGFAATNIVMGIGSYTLNMNSRDTLGFAAKATYCEIVNAKLLAEDEFLGEKEAIEGIEIYKDPITDDGTKKSAKGLLMVGELDDGTYELHGQVDWRDEGKGALQTIFRDGEFYNTTTLTEIRNRLNENK